MFFSNKILTYYLLIKLLDYFNEYHKIYINLLKINTIIKSQTIERIHYYIKRLMKSLLEKWDSSGAHNAGYWGNFIPQIPNQFLQRYTRTIL